MKLTTDLIQKGMKGLLWFLMDTLIRVDHMVAAFHMFVIWYSRRYYYVPYTVPLFVLSFSVFVNAILNIAYDR